MNGQFGGYFESDPCWFCDHSNDWTSQYIMHPITGQQIRLHQRCIEKIAVIKELPDLS